VRIISDICRSAEGVFDHHQHFEAQAEAEEQLLEYKRAQNQKVGLQFVPWCARALRSSISTGAGVPCLRAHAYNVVLWLCLWEGLMAVWDMFLYGCL